MERARLLRWFHAGVAAVDARHRVCAVLAPQPIPPCWHLLAVGKAATDMAQGALEAWPTGCAGGVVVAPVGGELPPYITTFAGAHPVPDERSLAAGAALLAYAVQLATPEHCDEPVLLLVSGGASALAEVLHPEVTLADLQALTGAALADGADIVELNRRRRAVSRLKGGQLIAALGAQRVQALLVSDVPGDDPTVIGSGLACGAATAMRPAKLQVVARLEDALEAMLATASAEGCVLKRLPGRFAGDAVMVAGQFVDQCVQQRACCGAVKARWCCPRNPGEAGAINILHWRRPSIWPNVWSKPLVTIRSTHHHSCCSLPVRMALMATARTRAPWWMVTPPCAVRSV